MKATSGTGKTGPSRPKTPALRRTSPSSPKRSAASRRESLESRVRIRRNGLGLSQLQLAEACAITRQAVISIESGKYIPNTAVALKMARTLGCRVEDLFSLEPHVTEARVECWGTPAQMGTRLAMAQVRGRLIGHPVAPARPSFEGFPSADGLLVDSRDPGRVHLLASPSELDRTILLLGCDPSLEILSTHLLRHDRSLRLVCLPASSRAALEAVARGGAHVAGTHLRDPASGEHNLSHAHQALATTGGLVVGYASWDQGLILGAGNPLRVKSVQDLCRSKVRFVNREPGSGSRAEMDRLLAVAGIPTTAISGYDRILPGHMAVAHTVATGGADVGIGLRAAAEALGLDFVPLTHVRFDLVIPGDHLEHSGVKALLDILCTRAVGRDLSALPGYEIPHIGRVLARIPVHG